MRAFKQHAYENICIQVTKEQSLLYVAQSQAGAFGHGIEWSIDQWTRVSLSGYGELEELYPRLAEGGYVEDAREVDLHTTIHEVISGPMDDMKLPPRSIRNWQEITTFPSIEAFFEWSEGKSLGATFLSVDLFCCYRHRRGAKVGRKIEGVIRWYPMWPQERKHDV